MFRALGFGGKTQGPIKHKLPQTHSLIEMTVTGGGPRGSVTFEALHEKVFTVHALPGMHAGQTAVFVYQNPSGKFRFSSRCQLVKGSHAVFALPGKIETLALSAAASGAQKRQSVRLDATVPCMWRFAINGKGGGDFTRGALTDISRTGASLIAEREMRRGTQVEVKFQTASGQAPFELLGEVMRASKIEASGKFSLGLMFHGVTADQDRAIMDFINKRQAERRSRGLA